MSIHPRTTKSGRRYDVRLRDPDGRVYTGTFRTRKEAETFESREKADRSRGWWLDPRGADHTLEAVAEAMPEEYQAMVWLGTILGGRWSEVAGLRVGQVDLLRKKVAVTEALTRDAQGHPVFDSPKSAAGQRTIAMSEELADLVAEHLARRGLTAADSDHLVFEAPKGGPLRYSNWRRRVWLPATVAAGCEGAGFHDLRRASGTALIVGGVDVRTVQARLSHADPRTTLNLYTQVVTEADRRAAETVGQAFLGTRERDGRAIGHPEVRDETGLKPI
jgi:integrase